MRLSLHVNRQRHRPSQDSLRPRGLQGRPLGWQPVCRQETLVRQLENHHYVLFIRPRRFGKTCWLSMLECYYDRNRRDEFETVFGGTNIGASPTANRGKYIVLRFNFSGMDAP